MTEQQISKELWNEFEAELNKSEMIKVKYNQNLVRIQNRGIEKFWNIFLNEKLPEGSINKTLEKNFAVYIISNKLDINQIKEKYKAQGWNIGALLGWIKKVNAGEITEFNIAELMVWCQNFKPNLMPYLQFQSEIEITKPTEEFKIIWDKDLINYQQKESNWLVEGLIKVGSINVLGGKRSTLKSWFSEIMGYSIANGIDFLGKFKTLKGKVLCLDRENQFSELKIRSRLIKAGLDLNENSDIAFLSETYIKLDNPLDVKRLETFITENEVKLLIVDVYRRVISFDENDAKEVSALFVDLLKPLTERTGITILLIHHEKKGESSGDDMDMLRGSSDLANYVDGIIQVERRGETLTIKQNKSRGSKEIEPFQVRIETNEIDYFKLVYKGAVETTSTFIAKEIIKWVQLEHKTEFTYTQVLRYCEELGYKKNNIVNALSDLRNKGIITKGNSERSPYTITRDVVGVEYG